MWRNGRVSKTWCYSTTKYASNRVDKFYIRQGLTEEQICDLKLEDEWGKKCIPSGGYVECKDEIGRRNGVGKLFPHQNNDHKQHRPRKWWKC